jgi:hypothetical protein
MTDDAERRVEPSDPPSEPEPALPEPEGPEPNGPEKDDEAETEKDDEADAEPRAAAKGKDREAKPAGGTSTPSPRREDAAEKRGAGRFRSTAIAAGVAIAVAAGGLYYGLSRPDGPAPIDQRATPKRAVDAVPAGTTLLVTIDLEALRASPLAAPYLAGERSIEGIGTIRQACGFDPLGMVREIALAVPEAYDAEFGIAAVGTFADQPVLDCATKVIGARGGRPVSSTLGSFRTVRDVDAPTTGEIAVRPGGPLLFGGGAYLRAMVDAVDGTLPSVGSQPAHGELRKELAGFETIQATLVLSKKQREGIAQELATVQASAPAAIGAVSAVAAGVSLVGDAAKVKIIVLCDDPGSAASLVHLANEAKKNAGESTPAALLGAEPLLARVQVEAQGARLVASVDAAVAEIDAIVERAIQLRALFEGGRPGAPPGPPVPAPPGSGPRPRGSGP